MQKGQDPPYPQRNDKYSKSENLAKRSLINVHSLNKRKYKDIQWREIAVMRDKIIRFYFGVNWDIVWQAVKDKLPQLQVKVENIFRETG